MRRHAFSRPAWTADGAWGTRDQRRRAAFAGVLAAAVALGVAQLCTVFVGGSGSPVPAIGAVVIDLTPAGLSDAAVQSVGTNDKPLLVLSILLAIGLLAGWVGQVALRNLARGLALVAIMALAAGAAAVSRPAGEPVDVLPSLLGGLAGAYALAALLGLIRGTPGEAGPANAGDVSLQRRRFLFGSLAAIGVAASSGGLSHLVTRRLDVSASRAAVRLPWPRIAAPPVPAGADLRIPGLSSFITPNRDFYRVDTALLVPQHPAEEWRLHVHGMVGRELEVDFAELLRRPLFEADVTLTCVSNDVGGPYVGNARWLGTGLADVLRQAGIRPGADQLLSRSVDGMTIGTPVELVMDGRSAMLAVGMNGEPLPVQHGFPVRMVVPGLYGYVSATKWVVDLQVTTFAESEAYWVRRGWAREAPIKTMSRIDRPTGDSALYVGSIPVAGVAWAQHRGVAGVEVRIDGGSWREARLAEVPSPDTWRQWVYEWDADMGEHRLEVRATDGTGTVQSSRSQASFPSGATGYDSVTVTVS